VYVERTRKRERERKTERVPVREDAEEYGGNAGKRGRGGKGEKECGAVTTSK